MFRRNPPTLLVVDDFYNDPDDVRDIALSADYGSDLRYFKGERSTSQYLFPYVKEEFERLLGVEITRWMDYDANGVFQITTPEDPLVYHYDLQRWAGAVYLNPDGGGGTSFWRHKLSGLVRGPALLPTEHFTDRDAWDHVETVVGRYNRLVIWDASLFHSAEVYADERLVHLYFFD